MGSVTSIDWCDSTFNPWLGCSHVHTGCARCFAETLMDTRYGRVKWGPNGTRVMTSPEYWKKPIAWNRAAQAANERRKVFCASLCDVFEEIGSDFVFNHRGETIYRAFPGVKNSNDPADHYRIGLPEIRRDLFDLIASTPMLDWLMLTKRPENIRPMVHRSCNDDSEHVCGLCGDSMCPRDSGRGKSCLPNVWFGTSVSDQETAEKQIPELLKCRGLTPVLFISAEPLLGPLDLTPWIKDIDWIILGGESGPNARPYWPAWAEAIIECCQKHGVACFHKQMGSNPQEVQVNHRSEDFDARMKLKDKKGGDPNEWSEDLRVRQFPKI